MMCAREIGVFVCERGRERESDYVTILYTIIKAEIYIYIKKGN